MMVGDGWYCIISHAVVTQFPAVLNIKWPKTYDGLLDKLKFVNINIYDVSWLQVRRRAR